MSSNKHFKCLSVCVCVCACAHACICVYTCACVCAFVHMHLCMCVFHLNWLCICLQSWHPWHFDPGELWGWQGWCLDRWRPVQAVASSHVLTEEKTYFQTATVKFDTLDVHQWTRKSIRFSHLSSWSSREENDLFCSLTWSQWRRVEHGVPPVSVLYLVLSWLMAVSIYVMPKKRHRSLTFCATCLPRLRTSYLMSASDPVAHRYTTFII